MMASVITALLMILLLESGTWAFQWTSNSIQSGSTITVCNGQHSVNLVWGYIDEGSERDNDIVWTFKTGEYSSEILLASVYRGHFFTEPNIRQHLSFVPPSTLQITDLTSQDNGIYTIQVNVNQFGSILTHNSTVNVQIADSFAVSRNALHVNKLSDLIYDNDAREYRAQLSCGTFTSLGHPPVGVVFKTPSHEVLNDTTYENGRFVVTIPNPVAGGDYTCQIANPQDTCLPANSPLLAPATVHIAGCNVQLDIANAELSAMKTQAHHYADAQHEIQRLRNENSYLNTTNRALGVELQQERQARYECTQQLGEHTESHHQEVTTTSYNGPTCTYGHFCDYTSPSSRYATDSTTYTTTSTSTPPPPPPTTTTTTSNWWETPSTYPTTTSTSNWWWTTSRYPTTSSSHFPYWWSSTPSPFQYNTQQLEVRLVGGSGCHEGILEVRPYGCSQWGTVCDDSWDSADALVVCRQLGYTGVSISLYHPAEGSGPILLDDVACNGYERDLGQCYIPLGFGRHNCGHNEDVWIRCA